jgi:hypothetical protein
VKQGGGASIFGAKTWKSRWFVLRAGGTLSYYKDEKDWRSGCPPLKDAVYKAKACSVAEDSSTVAAAASFDGGGSGGGGSGGGGGAFGMIIQPRTAAGGPRRLLLRTDTSADLARWMDALLSYAPNKPKGAGAR